jgi:hypothetical protein
VGKHRHARAPTAISLRDSFKGRHRKPDVTDMAPAALPRPFRRQSAVVLAATSFVVVPVVVIMVSAGGVTRAASAGPNAVGVPSVGLVGGGVTALAVTRAIPRGASTLPGAKGPRDSKSYTLAKAEPSTTRALFPAKNSSPAVSHSLVPAKSVGGYAQTTAVAKPTSTASATIGVGKDVGGRKMLLGATHTQADADSWRNPTATARAKTVLRSAVNLQDTSIMGWGLLNPEPSPGVYEWSGLDARVAAMRATGGEMVITLAAAPDWMKGAAPGTTNWNNIEVAPTPQHYQDFANLAAAIAKRYTDVKYFSVWNEMKGFFDATANHWNYVGYTQMYNDVYDALKAVNPAINVGGPYVNVDLWGNPSAGGHPSALSGPWGTVDQRPLDVITYWLAHAHGANFIAIDGSTGTRDRGLVTNPYAAAEYFAAVNKWLQERTKLPIWWMEVYAGMPAGTSLASPAAAQISWNAFSVLASSGAAAAMLWDPERFSGSATPGLWTSTDTSSGGLETPLAAAFAKYLQTG